MMDAGKTITNNSTLRLAATVPLSRLELDRATSIWLGDS